VVEFLPSKQGVAGSSPVSRSFSFKLRFGEAWKGVFLGNPTSLYPTELSIHEGCEKTLLDTSVQNIISFAEEEPQKTVSRYWCLDIPRRIG
jgi:hypothetical protein